MANDHGLRPIMSEAAADIEAERFFAHYAECHGHIPVDLRIGTLAACTEIGQAILRKAVALGVNVMLAG